MAQRAKLGKKTNLQKAGIAAFIFIALLFAPIILFQFTFMLLFSAATQGFAEFIIHSLSGSSAITVPIMGTLWLISTFMALLFTIRYFIKHLSEKTG